MSFSGQGNEGYLERVERFTNRKGRGAPRDFRVFVWKCDVLHTISLRREYLI